MKAPATFSLADAGWSKPVLDRSVAPLVIANAIVIGAAIAEGWTFADAAAAYWA